MVGDGWAWEPGRRSRSRHRGIGTPLPLLTAAFFSSLSFNSFPLSFSFFFPFPAAFRDRFSSFYRYDLGFILFNSFFFLVFSLAGLLARCGERFGAALTAVKAVRFATLFTRSCSTVPRDPRHARPTCL